MKKKSRFSLFQKPGNQSFTRIFYRMIQLVVNAALTRILELDAMRSRSGVDVIVNLSGLKAVVFLWRFGPLLSEARAIFWDAIVTSHQPFFSL